MHVGISGAGVAGPTLAWWLRRQGHEVTLIERAPEFRSGGYIVDFWGHGYTVAERMGILPAIRGLGYQVESVRVVDGRGGEVGGFEADVFQRATRGRYTSLPRGDLAATIFDALPADVETIFGDSIVALEERSDGVTALLESRGERRFDLVAGADGLHSAVRRIRFGPQESFEWPIGYRVAVFEAQGYRPRDEKTYVLYNEPGMQVARFALRDDRTTFMLVFREEFVAGREARDDAERRALLHDVFDRAGWESPRVMAAMDAADDVYLDRVSQIRMDAWSRGRVVLLGDAAACVSLLAGEGTSLAMLEAYVLAGELARHGGEHRAAFASYEALLRPLLERKQRAAERFASSFAPKTRAGLLFRNLVSRLLRFPWIADYFIGRDLSDDTFPLPDYEAVPDAVANR